VCEVCFRYCNIIYRIHYLNLSDKHITTTRSTQWVYTSAKLRLPQTDPRNVVHHIQPILLYTKLDAQCDKLRMVLLGCRQHLLCWKFCKCRVGNKVPERSQSISIQYGKLVQYYLQTATCIQHNLKFTLEKFIRNYTGSVLIFCNVLLSETLSKSLDWEKFSYGKLTFQLVL